MTRVNMLNIAGKAAIIAALMGGSSLSYAQDAIPTVAVPDQSTQVEAPTAAPTVVPPPAVRTLPTVNDTINPAAAQEAAAEAASKRESAAARNPATRRSATVAAPIAPNAPATVEPVDAPVVNIAPSADAIEPASVSIADTAPIPPIDEPVAAETALSNEDVTLVGGLAAALAALGLGAAFASRRRRRIVADDRVAVNSQAPEYAAPPPIKDDPVFQQFAPAVNPAPVAQRPITRAPIMTRPDVPITDPLFSTPVMAGPITDPLFAPRNDVQPPITDPLFAKHDRFVGRAPASSTTVPERELVN